MISKHSHSHEFLCLNLMNFGIMSSRFLWSWVAWSDSWRTKIQFPNKLIEGHLRVVLVLDHQTSEQQIILCEICYSLSISASSTIAPQRRLEAHSLKRLWKFSFISYKKKHGFSTNLAACCCFLQVIMKMAAYRKLLARITSKLALV